MKRGKSVFSKEKIKEYIKPTKKKTIIAVIALIVPVTAIALVSGKKGKPAVNMARETDIVTRGDVEVTITGSASVEPYERYEIIPKVNGDITYCPFDVGDQVEKGDMLYAFDTSSTDLTVERQRISLQQSKNSYNDALEQRDKLSVTAKTSGVISDLTIKEGQEVNNGAKIASIADTDTLEVVLPFTQSQIGAISIGSSAEITSSKHMSTVSGTVTHKATSSYAANDGSALYNVTITFTNPGAFYAGMEVGGSAAGQVSPGSGTVGNSSSADLTAETSGTVVKVNYQNGDYVKKGAVIATLSSDTVNDNIENSTLSYKSASLSMQQSEKDLEDYRITSPISGTVITKNSKTGDTIDKTNSQTIMMVIADISRLKFDLSIDELDVSKVSEGQEVSITCDALPDEKFTGYITNLSVEGTATNGVTTYSAEVIIEEPGNLRPSMNIDASIIVDSARDVLTVPTEDIKTVGDKSYVYVKDDGKKQASPADGDKANGKSNAKTDDKANGKADEKANGSNPGAPADGDNAQMPNDAQNGKRDMTPQAPDGYTAVEVVKGISNDEYTEIISGLSEGQEIYRQSVSSDSSASGMPGMGGMGGMGGMSGGGMGGGAPGGGGGGMGGGPGGR